MKNIKIKKITDTALLLALTIAFSLIENYIKIGFVPLNLTLVIIAFGGIILGPLGGAMLGAISGIFIIIAPDTSLFLNISILGTIITCIVKGVAVGLISGFLYKLFTNKKIGVIISSMLAPIINTGLFIIFYFIFFNVEEKSLIILIQSFIGLNFLIEFIISTLLTPTLVGLTKIIKTKRIH